MVRFWMLGLGLMTGLGWSDRTPAQVVPDQTLPVTERSQVSGTADTQIDGGAIRGSNLFHSFQQFSIPTGDSASFNNAPTITNIITRVTGSNVSNIDGLIRANGTANLFLINPNGILFGTNARLELGGSFLASTADRVLFNDGFAFSASDPQAPPLLTISAPLPSAHARVSGLQLGQNPGGIRVQGAGSNLSVQVPAVSPLIRGSLSTGLQVKPGNTLALVGGAVEIEGGTLTTEQGRIELGSVRAGQVNLSFVPQGLSLSYRNAQNFQDIQLSQQALVDAIGASSIQVQGNQVSLLNGSLLLNRSPGAQGGGEILVKAERLTLSGLSFDGMFSSGLSSQTTGIGNGADIAVFTKQIVGQGGAQINASSFSSGKTGNITINASEFVKFTDSIFAGNFPSPMLLSSGIVMASFQTGNGGAINLATRQLSLLRGASIGALTIGKGQSGSVIVNASDAIEIAGQTPILTSGSISSSTFSEGDAGSMTINTARLIVRDGGAVSSAALASGNAGDLTIQATDSIEVSGRVPNSLAPTDLASSAPVVSEQVQQVFQLPAKPSGNSANLFITTPRLVVRDGAIVRVGNEGSGTAGSLAIKTDSLRLDEGTITAATASGEGGNIDLNVRDDLLLRRASQLTASAQGTGNGGNIQINGGFLIAVPSENSNISANSVNSRGGNVRINATAIYGIQPRSTPTSLSSITATGATSALSGTIDITTPGLDPTSGLVELPTALVDSSGLIASTCPADKGNSFAITGRGGLPEDPRQPLMGDSVWLDDRATEQSQSTTPDPMPQIVETQGWIRDRAGRIILTADRPHTIAQPLLCLVPFVRSQRSQR